MFQGYRTILFNMFAAIVMAADIIVDMGYLPEVQYFINDEWKPLFMLAIIFSNIVLRVKTTTPVGQKPK